jgi:hypothetical protein
MLISISTTLNGNQNNLKNNKNLFKTPFISSINSVKLKPYKYLQYLKIKPMIYLLHSLMTWKPTNLLTKNNQ